MKLENIQVRRDICRGCKRDCDVRDVINHANPCAECPQRVWHAMGRCEQESPDTGLGDAVAFVAQPIARAIDRILGTNVEGCGGCKARKAALNKLFHFDTK